MDGKDNDNNGFVDDVHGIAFDLEANKIPELVHPLDKLNAKPEEVMKFTKGFSDNNSNIDSKEAGELRVHMGGMSKDQVTPFIEDLGLFGNHSHGTHVAGIAAAGNPFVRLMPVRITFDYKVIPTLTPTVEQAKKDAQAAIDAVKYMVDANVRVVNMSWGGSREGIEGALEMKGVGKTPEERAAMSRKLFSIGKNALEEAMNGAPDILFIAAAGNSDNDNTFSEMIPSGLDVGNMITVGAIDGAGKPTNFTSFGKNVELYANGFEIESYVPGGVRMKYSGTSMAAPQVANLAAKILAINPSLSGKQVVEYMKKGADLLANYPDRFIINPKKTIALVRNQ
jgi:subtilisin family serine protease